MPLVRITYPRGALTRSQKREIARSLTDIVLDAEVDAVTENGRLVTVIHFNEAAADDWAVAGELRSAAEAEAPDHFIVDVIVLEGLLEGSRRADVHRRVSEAFQKAFGASAHPMLPLRVWVLVHDVREGSWGVGGQALSALDVAQFINPELGTARRAEIVGFLSRFLLPTHPPLEKGD
jgi:phenylpyruvate tautomerase PptA (4-oxalocrotonate tautomerase family)